MKTELSEEVLRFLSTPRIIDATDPTVNGSHTYNSKFVSDEDNIIALLPSRVSLNHHLNLNRETEEYINKTEAAWSEYKKTDKGKNAFSGPILSPTNINISTDPEVQVDFQLKLITYAEFFANYGPNFSIEEKQRNYSIGINSIVKTVDNAFVFGMRNPKLHSAGGIFEPAGFFLNIDKMITNDETNKFKKDIKNEDFRQKLQNGSYGDLKLFEIEKTNMDDGYIVDGRLNTETYRELGIKPKDIDDVTYLAVTKKDLYLNYNIFMIAESNLESGQIIESSKKWGDGKLSKAISVPIQSLNDWILTNKNEITPTLKSILRCYSMT